MSKLARFTAYLNKFLLTREEWEQLQSAIKEEIQHETILEADNAKLRAALVAIEQGNTGEFSPAQVAGAVLGGK